MIGIKERERDYVLLLLLLKLKCRGTPLLSQCWMFNMNEEKYMPLGSNICHSLSVTIVDPTTVLVYHRILWARPNAKKQDGRESLLGIS